jgi:uncharacterized protein DUF2849
MSEIKEKRRLTDEAADISAARGGRGSALKAITANRLADGLVVYLGAGGDWVEPIEGARIADGKDEAAVLLAEAERAAAACRVVAPYAIDVVRNADGAVRPASYRERIRAFGPSIHPQFGRPEAAS